MKKSYWKIIWILWDVLRIVLKIFRIETSIVGNTSKHNHLRSYIQEICKKRKWNFTEVQIDSGIRNTISTLKKVFNKEK